jgi:hypothetical protein
MGTSMLHLKVRHNLYPLLVDRSVSSCPKCIAADILGAEIEIQNAIRGAVPVRERSDLHGPLCCAPVVLSPKDREKELWEGEFLRACC